MIEKQEKRYRNWGIIAYPESLPSNWVNILNELRIPFCYILHNEDVRVTKDGEIVSVKPHYHIFLKYKNQQSYQQMLSLTGRLHAPNPQHVFDSRGYVADFIHMYETNKFQYPISDIKEFNGIDVEEILKPTKTELYEVLEEIRMFIRDNQITELADLIDYAGAKNRFWSRIIVREHNYLGKYITSRRYRPRRDITPGGILLEDITPEKILPEIASTLQTQSFMASRNYNELKALALKEAHENGFFNLDY